MQQDVLSGVRDWFFQWFVGWDKFWFTPSQPQTLAMIRIACGAMLFYVHLIWTSSLTDFMGRSAWLNRNAIQQLHTEDFGWSWLFYTDNLALLWCHEAIAMLACLCMALGLVSRVTIPLAWWMTLMVCHRMTGALFGLDQVVVMLAMYLMWSNCGAVYSLDAVLRRRTGGERWWVHSTTPAVRNTIATRLIQLHLCVIYLFGGLSKMRGEKWFDGSALWYTAVNYEYQSLDLTWLGHFPILIAALTAATIFWETFYCALVWPKQTRPVALGMAVFVHGGIAVGLGMITFGTIMIVANLAFISPATTEKIVALVSNRFSAKR